MKKTAAAAMAVIGLCALTSQSVAFSATSASATKAKGAQCRTIRDRGSETGDPAMKVTARKCDTIYVSFVFGTQGPAIPTYEISKRPSAKVLKVGRAGQSSQSEDTASAYFNFLAVGTGTTKVSFKGTEPGQGTLDSETITITVLP
jgi:hypothetical protein